MKTALIALGALVLSSGAVLARDVNSTAPDNDELSHVVTQADASSQYPADYSTTASIRNGSHVIIKNDPATQPD